MRIKGKILVSSLLAILLIASARSATATGTTGINVDPQYQEVDIEDTFTVTINVTDVEDPGIYAYEFKLYYDNTLLNATDATYPSGHFLEGTYTFMVPIEINRESGYVLFGATLLGDELGRTGSGVLATVEFDGISVGSVLLEIKDVTSLDPDGNVMDYITNDGEVNVIPEFTPALIMFVFMAITLVVIMLKKLTASKNHNAYCP